MVTLDGDVVARYPRVSRYNSPYPAHDAGCAVDLYSDDGWNADGHATAAPSPVAGEVVETRTVSCPDRPYAADHDHLIVLDTGDALARVLHVDPGVEAGERVTVGDSLGEMVRSGFFAPWVDNHLHLGFREHGQNAVRASGSLPLDLDVAVEPATWDGRATVVETGETWLRLDEPTHPAPGDAYAALASDDGAVLDGGLPHYETGYASGRGETVSLFGTVAGDRSGDRTVTWRDVTVTVDGAPAKGLSLWLGRDALGCKVVAPGHDVTTGDEVTVDIRSADRSAD
ncbi:hypothetical protein [Halobacterium jilantaiense]|uniref:Peptidase family M23 n=1 Tax=Halobacterium jilantaiense TaxID=355548 RepID=A0A1I0PGV0_9EURY|nr:hypothetical protein [Halobacterium jilantaiense]SEW13559.1 hypothetical protein SAMN04487945_1679 [Halobacterium jilantaiense]